MRPPSTRCSQMLNGMRKASSGAYAMSLGPRRIEEAELGSAGMQGVDREVGALAIPGGTQPSRHVRGEEGQRRMSLLSNRTRRIRESPRSTTTSVTSVHTIVNATFAISVVLRNPARK